MTLSARGGIVAPMSDEEYSRARKARDEQDAILHEIETANRDKLRAAVEAVLAQWKDKPGVTRLIAAYHNTEKNAPKEITLTTRE